MYKGKAEEYNFSKFWTGSRITFSFEEGEATNRWTLNAINRQTILELELKCASDEMLFINYESPDGEKRHTRLWNGGTGFGTAKL
ncbi:MAG: hypothetical protein D6B26_04450 [Spirochaetaceae bacterium]|nr:MAG: hypothetical protein D6B26_04450 [Spirochaetaceae bacterium]